VAAALVPETSASAETVAPSTAPGWSTEFNPWPVGLFDTRKPPVVRWLPFVGGDIGPTGDSLIYPAWLVGTWDVKYRKDDVRLPKGWFVMNPQVPGVSMASVLRLPNVGAEPLARWRFEPASAVDGRQGARPDWAFTLPRVLESFWDQAKSGAAPTRRAGVGWAVNYSSPVAGTPKGSLTERTVLLMWLAGDTWEDEADGSCLSIEWLRQRDELLGPDGAFDYKVLTALRRVDDVQRVDGFVRVGAFLRPVDDGYMEANGEAVAVYDYSVTLTRVPDIAA